MTDEGVYQALKRVPQGRVISYGDVATLAGGSKRNDARVVGLNVSKLGWDGDVPWWRVLPQSGATSSPPDLQGLREKLLASEGVRVGDNGKVCWEMGGADPVRRHSESVGGVERGVRVSEKELGRTGTDQ